MRGGGDFSSDDHSITVGEVLQRSADDLFAPPVRIHIGRVEEVDSRLNRMAD